MTQLSKLQMSNLGAVIALLTSIPDKDYNHSHFGVVYGDRDYDRPNAVCAVGHAIKNPGKFRVEVPAEKRNFIQRLFGIKTGKPTNGNYPRIFARDVFGDALWYHAFESDAYGMEPRDVTKNMVLARLFAVKAAGAVPA